MSRLPSISLLNIYIPRMLSDVTKQTVIDAFHSQHIGTAFYIDMHYKVNQRQNAYYFAFITLSLYDTDEAKQLVKTLDNFGSMKVVYDPEAFQYWEVKKHVDRNERIPSPPLSPVKQEYPLSPVKPDCIDMHRFETIAPNSARSYKDAVTKPNDNIGDYAVAEWPDNLVEHTDNLVEQTDHLTDDFAELSNAIEVERTQDLLYFTQDISPKPYVSYFNFGWKWMAEMDEERNRICDELGHCPIHIIGY